MKIFIICSKSFYDQIPDIKKKLEDMGHEVILPNCFDAPGTEEKMLELGSKAHAAFKCEMYSRSEKCISQVDSVLVLNFQKYSMEGYIGGATFLEMYDAFKMKKKIFIYNPFPSTIISDEIQGFLPKILYGDIEKIDYC